MTTLFFTILRLFMLCIYCIVIYDGTPSEEVSLLSTSNTYTSNYK